MIDPFTAMAAVSSAVNLIKKASATVNDVRSLGPLLGQYFDAKHEATKAVKEAKKKGGSNMGRAIQVEMSLMQQKQFEDELKMLFFTTGNADVWENIMIRVNQMNRDDALEAKREKEAAARRRKELEETIQVIVGSAMIATVLAGVVYAIVSAYIYCKSHICGY